MDTKVNEAVKENDIRTNKNITYDDVENDDYQLSLLHDRVFKQIFLHANNRAALISLLSDTTEIPKDQFGGLQIIDPTERITDIEQKKVLEAGAD